MPQRRAVWLLSLAILGIVAYGAWYWSQRRSVERAAHIFLAAMIEGDAETLLQYLDGPALKAYSAKSHDEQSDFTNSIPGARAEIREVHMRISSARVRVLWQVSGFDVWSDLELAKSDSGGWKVTNIHEPRMIPTWDQVRKRLQEDAKTPAHETLGDKFEDRDGVEVRPLSSDDLDQ